MVMRMLDETGFRVFDGITDVVVEAWGPTRLDCIEAAAKALVDTPPLPEEPLVEFEQPLRSGEDEALLAEVLTAVLKAPPRVGGSVTGVALEASPEEGVTLRIRVGAADRSARRRLRRVSVDWVWMGPVPGGWRCRAIMDR